MESYALFRKHLLSFIIPEANNINVHNARGMQVLTTLRVGFIHLKERKFWQNFEDALNPLCSCGNFAELTAHFFLQCTYFSNQRLTLTNKIKDIDKRIFDKNDSLTTQALLFWGEKLSITDNKSILEATIQFSISWGRFDSPLFQLLDVLSPWTVFVCFRANIFEPLSLELSFKFFNLIFHDFFFVIAISN